MPEGISTYLGALFVLASIAALAYNWYRDKRREPAVDQKVQAETEAARASRSAATSVELKSTLDVVGTLMDAKFDTFREWVGGKFLQADQQLVDIRRRLSRIENKVDIVEPPGNSHES